jgi:aldehyde dehydrogenase (NAD+)
MSMGRLASGFFMAPTVIADLPDSSVVVREEIFGPVLCVARFSTLSEVIQRANDTPFGLGCGVWSRDQAKIRRIAAEVRAGSVWANCYNLRDAAVPFGGYKMSGLGRDGGRQHLEDYLQTKSVFVA